MKILSSKILQLNVPIRKAPTLACVHRIITETVCRAAVKVSFVGQTCTYDN